MDLGVDRKWQIVRPIQNSQPIWNDFDIAGRKFRIFRSRHARRNTAGHFDHIFATQTVGLLRYFGILFRAKDDLGKAFAVAQIDENDAAMVARNVHPSGEGGFVADVSFAQ